MHRTTRISTASPHAFIKALVLGPGLFGCRVYRGVHKKQKNITHQMMMIAAMAAAAVAGPPLPTPRQLEFMEMETVQFMHFNVDTVREPARPPPLSPLSLF